MRVQDPHLQRQNATAKRTLSPPVYDAAPKRPAQEAQMSQRTERIKSLASMSWFRAGALLVQPDRLVVMLDGREIALEPRVMEVLVALAEHAGEVVSAEQLLIEVWHGTFYGDNPVHKAIAHLRRLVDDDSRAPRFIETIRKRGYRLIAKVGFPDDYRRAAIQPTTHTDRSPYVGLSAFDGEHADVFFGRSRMTAELLSAMRKQIDNQRRFVMIVGASGCGKTSLVRAGAIPLLQQEHGFDGLRSLSVASCDLAAAQGGDLLVHLASALAAWTLGERPVLAPQSPAALAEEFAQRPAAIAEAIDEAILRHAQRHLVEQPYAHLLLVIDHAEALVASPNIGVEERTAFAAIIDALCESPRAMVTMTVRSDFYPKLSEAVPELAQRKGGDGHVDVFTPRRGEIAQIIRTPALLAGLSFEEDAQTLMRLDDVLRDAASEHPDALPLLQHTLQSLYERRDAAGVLSFAAYRDIGGLEGALAHRAEAVYAELPVDARRSLDRVLAQLIVIQSDSDSISARRVLSSTLVDADAAVLVEAFIRARLFVGELNDGRPAFGVAHESLLRQWPRARDWAQDNRRLLQARARLQRAAARWVEEGRRSDHLLNTGRPLSEAQEVAHGSSDDLADDERAFLHASERQHQRRRWLRIGATAALAVLALVSSALAVLAQRARNEAEQRREEGLRLTGFMLVDLADKLRPLGNLKLLSSISSEALASLDRQPTTELRAEDLVNRSRALRTLGEVLMEQAKLEEARTAFAAADRSARAAVAASPASADALAESGLAAYWLGYYHYRRNEFDQARALWTSYLDSTQMLVRLQPDNPAWLVEESYAHNNLGTLARDLGRADEAVTYFKRSADLKRRALAVRPNDNLRYESLDTLSWISGADESQGRLAEAAAGYAEQIGILRTLIAANPGARAWERRLATSLLRSATLAVTRGVLDDAAVQIEESVARLSRLTEQEPDNRVWLRDLAHAHMEAADIARMRDDQSGRRAHLRLAHSVAQSLRSDTASPLSWKKLDAMIRIRAAQSLAGVGDPEGEWDRAITDLKFVTDRAEGDVYDISAVAQELVARGRRRVLAGQRDSARNDLLNAVNLLRDIAPGSKDARALAPWIGAHVLLGQRAVVEAQIAWLARIGYRHPDFELVVAEGGQPAQERGATSDAGSRPQ
jgi:eukaryotic-like serine/threonine-protein kinase